MMFPAHLMLLVFVVVPLCSGHYDTQLGQDERPKVYCGRTLARMIAALCYDGDNNSFEKRSKSGTMYGNIIPPYYKEPSTEVGWPWIPASKARNVGSFRGKRIAGGVADECCDKPCTISELLDYC